MRERKREVKLRKWVNERLKKCYVEGKGMPKHDIKDIHNSTPYIHSEETYKTYKKQAGYFVEWCYAHNIKKPKEAFAVIPDYLKELEEKEMSAWTISTRLNAIAKVYGVSTTEIPYTPPRRERAKIKRSRYAAERDKHFSTTANKELWTFCGCVGLREKKELERITGDALIEKENGDLYVRVKGKGGKWRDAPVVGTAEEKRMVKRIMHQAGEGMVFPHVHTALDVHSRRADYACKIYKMYARPIKEIPKKEQYACRKDYAGRIYDRKAMEIVSKALGHNRIDVVANNYLHRLPVPEKD